MASQKKLSKQELKREPLFNRWLRKIQARVEETGTDWFKAGIGIVAVLAVIGGIYAFYTYNRNKAETAFARALELYTAEVKEPKDVPTTPSAKKYYTDEKQKYKEAADAFEQAAGYSSQREKSRYYAALCRLKLDAPQGQKELRALAEGDGQVSQMARLALANSLAGTDGAEEAVGLYKQLISIWDKNKGVGALLPPEAAHFAIGNLREQQNNPAEAVKSYLEAIKTNRNSQIASNAYERLSVLDPETARKMVPPKRDSDII